MSWHEFISDIVLIPAGAIYLLGVVTGMVLTLFIDKK